MVLRINDRGPFVSGRIIDLSRAAAHEIGMFSAGVAKVEVKAITAKKATQLSAASANSTVAAQVNSAPVISQEPAISAGTRPGFGVRVCSTTDRSYAENVISTLKRNYPAVSLNSYDHNGQAAYIVTIDGLDSKKEADKVRSRLAFRGYGEAKVVTR